MKLNFPLVNWVHSRHFRFSDWLIHFSLKAYIITIVSFYRYFRPFFKQIDHCIFSWVLLCNRIWIFWWFNFAHEWVSYNFNILRRNTVLIIYIQLLEWRIFRIVFLLIKAIHIIVFNLGAKLNSHLCCYKWFFFLSFRTLSIIWLFNWIFRFHLHYQIPISIWYFKSTSNFFVLWISRLEICSLNISAVSTRRIKISGWWYFIMLCNYNRTILWLILDM